MTYAIIYSTRTGNTKLLADALREALPEAFCRYFGPPDPAALEADRIYVGFWTDRGTCNRETADFLHTVTHQEIFLFGTAGFGPDPAYFEKILKKTKKNLKTAAPVIGTYLCQGKMPMAVRQKYEKMSHGLLRIPHAKALLENFDRALSHPDGADLAGLKAAVLEKQSES